MAEGKYKASGEMAFNNEEKIELTAPCTVEWSGEKGADSIETSINCDYVHGTKSLDGNKDRNQLSQSNMIISNEQTRSKVNLLVATCSGTFLFFIFRAITNLPIRLPIICIHVFYFFFLT